MSSSEYCRSFPSKQTMLAFSVLMCALASGCQRFQAEPLAANEKAAQFDSRTLDEPGLRTFMEQSLGAPIPEWPLTTWNFQELSLAMFYFQPTFKVNRAQWALAEAARKTAGGWRNPVLTVTPGISMNAPAGTTPWFPLASVDVPIETAGKRGHRINQAAHLSEAARLNIQAAAWQGRAKLRTALLDWHFSQTRAELLDRQLEFQRQTVQLLEQRLAAGAASPLEVTTARTARLRTETDAADAHFRIIAARVTLAEAIGVPAAAINPVKISAEAPEFPSKEADLLQVGARNRALRGRADILAALQEYAAAEAALRLEIARQYPDVHLNPGYQFDEGEHKWSIGLSVELPVLNRNEGPIAEAEAKRAEAAARFEAIQARVIAEIDLADSEYRGLRDQLKRSRELLDLERTRSKTIDVAFQAGSADRLELTSAQLEAGIAELAVADLEARARGALGRLEDALQFPVAGIDRVDQVASRETASRGTK